MLQTSCSAERVNVGASTSSAEPASRPAHRVSFVEVPSLDDDNRASIDSEKVPPSEGLHSVLRLLFQLCSSAAVEAHLQPQRACEFEGLFGVALKPVAAEVPTNLFHRVANLFHRVAELLSEARLRFQTALDAGKLPASGLPLRHRGPGSYAEPTLWDAAPFNASLFRLVGSFFSKLSINLSFDEAAKVKSLARGILDAQSISFWLFLTLLHWLKELGFVPSDPALFEQLVQPLSMSFVGESSSAASLATFFQAKRRKGVLSYFPSHVGIHFPRELVGFFFSGPNLFEEEVLVRVIAASREDSHLYVQLSIARAFSLPVFLGARNPDRKASLQEFAAASSTSAQRGRERGYLDSRGGKRKASSCPGKSRSSKSPSRGTSLSSKGWGFANRSYVPAQQ